jgi:hypothetical protein
MSDTPSGCLALFDVNENNLRCRSRPSRFRKAARVVGIRSILSGSVLTNDSTVCHEGPVVEAFPNAFLGGLMPEGELLAAPKLKRGRRFDWLYKWIVKSDPKHLGEFWTCKIYRPNLTVSLANPIE